MIPAPRLPLSAHADEQAVLADLVARFAPSEAVRAAATARAVGLVREIRADRRPGLMEVFLGEYGLSTREGLALMTLAEALLRVPDAATMDELIEDKIAPQDWKLHRGRSPSALVNASTLALMLTGEVLKDRRDLAGAFLGAVKRLGEPVIRSAVARAMREMGAQFVLGRTIDEALSRGRDKAAMGYTFSYDMLGEAAMTAADAARFLAAYKGAIGRLAPECRSPDTRANPGISVKLSALHPRYETAQQDRVMTELVPRVLDLALAAKSAGMGMNIDAEEADRLELSLAVIEAVLSEERLAGWDGFGVVVQGYGLRASAVIDWLHALATRLDRRIMVRLVKGAYWDTEIKRAQVEGLEGFPVFTRKAATDVAYLCCARQLLGLTDRIYPQFATHNAHSVAAILEMADDPQAFEFQRLHGMGEALHDRILAGNATRCRIYAPVGAHRELLAYLVRRLLENGANSSFVHKIADPEVPPEAVARDPFAALDNAPSGPGVTRPADLFAPGRRNSRGWDLHEPEGLAAYLAARAPFADRQWTAAPTVEAAPGETLPVTAPDAPGQTVGTVTQAGAAAIEAALSGTRAWTATPDDRAAALERAADLFEAHAGEIFALLAREAGKCPPDAVAELREAVDFLRYYATRARADRPEGRGVFACISPWNFPLAIFTGQVAGALAAGNGVIAKPAEATPLVAALATRLLHEAGVPPEALALLPGEGRTVGAALSADPRIAGVCFTGSTTTAQTINRAMAAHLNPAAPLIAETGGLNAMIVDSTALPEQAVRDIVLSAFRSAGQRCSALRLLYVQEDIVPGLMAMLTGAMDELRLGAPWDPATDVGPVIDAAAQAKIAAHVARARAEGRVIHEITAPEDGHFIGPVAIRVGGMADLGEEIFGPVLHVATFRAQDLDAVLDAVNASGYGLTFGLHSRIEDRAFHVADRLRVGNLYINRNQIGAVVGSQPFGGEGLSGTGPKAGGPAYVARMGKAGRARPEPVPGPEADAGAVARAVAEARARLPSGPLSETDLPGPTGERNLLRHYGRGVVLCLGPTPEAALAQATAAEAAGATAVRICPGARGALAVDGVLPPDRLRTLDGIDAVVLQGTDAALRPVRQALAARDGRLIPLIAEDDIAARCRLERHVCTDTTAAGGNASLLAQAG
jgi:RHH-type proline utilization regulon transcriptional repressor/proline dehydrogenase/delta 1-pyrroline-5-carboxylate dehydrogenase